MGLQSSTTVRWTALGKQAPDRTELGAGDLTCLIPPSPSSLLWPDASPSPPDPSITSAFFVPLKQLKGRLRPSDPISHLSWIFFNLPKGISKQGWHLHCTDQEARTLEAAQSRCSSKSPKDQKHYSQKNCWMITESLPDFKHQCKTLLWMRQWKLSSDNVIY